MKKNLMNVIFILLVSLAFNLLGCWHNGQDGVVETGEENVLLRCRVTNFTTRITSNNIEAKEGDILEYTLSIQAGEYDIEEFYIDEDNFITDSLFDYADLIDSGSGEFYDINNDGMFDGASFGPFDIPAYQTQEVRFQIQVTEIEGDFTMRCVFGDDVVIVNLDVPDIFQMNMIKSSDMFTVGNDQVITYTIIVTNNGATAQTITIIDSMAVSGSVKGTNGGKITFDEGSSNVFFDGGGTSAGEIEDPGGLTLYSIQPNRAVRISYTATCSNAGVPINESSYITNTAVLYQHGWEKYKAVRSVVVYGPGGGGNF